MAQAGARGALLATLLLLLTSWGPGGSAVAAVGPPGSAGAPAPPPLPPKPRGCNRVPGDVAFNKLTRLTGGAKMKVAAFMDSLARCSLTETFQRLVEGKVVLCPTNHAMEASFLSTGLLSSVPGDVVQLVEACKSLEALLPRLAVAQDALPGGFPCSLVYPTNSVEAPLEHLLPLRAPGQAASFAAASLGGGTVSKYSVLGTGYNSYIGFPLSAGLSPYDPGFTMGAVYQLVDSDVVTMSPSGGACETHFSTSTSYSSSEARTTILASGELSIDIAIASMQASGQFSQIKNDMDKSQATTTVSSAKVYLGGYGLRTQVATLDPYFVDWIDALASDPNNTDTMHGFIDTFGTHVISRMMYGGLASMLFTMTASSLVSTDNVTVSGQLSGNLGGPGQLSILSGSASGGFDASSSSVISSAAKTFGMVLIPALVPLPLTSGRQNVSDPNAKLQYYIDCPTWSAGIADVFNKEGWQAPVSYGLADITNLLNFPKLYPSYLRPRLPIIRDALVRYINTCAYVPGTTSATGCPQVGTDDCVAGSFRPPKPANLTQNLTCISCFDMPNTPPISPRCNATTSKTCDASSGTPVCICDTNFVLGQPDGSGYVKINVKKSDGTCCQTVHKDTLGCKIPAAPQYYPPAPALQDLVGTGR